MSQIGRIKSLLEQLCDGNWHSDSSLYAKGFGCGLTHIALIRGYIEVGGDKFRERFRITEVGKKLVEGQVSQPNKVSR